MDKRDKKDNCRKVKVELRLNTVNSLIKLKSMGDTYSDVIDKLLDDKK